MIYLGTPYSHEDPAIRELRYQQVSMVACRLIQDGEFVYSPITHCHPLALIGDLPKNWKYWAEYCEDFLRHCSKMIVLKIDGWRESEGLMAEIGLAKDKGIPIEYINFEDYQPKTSTETIETMETIEGA